MFIPVDKEIEKEKVEGFSYTSKEGYEEYVTLGEAFAVFGDSNGRVASVYYEDIPKLIKALQAAYMHNLKEKNVITN